MKASLRPSLILVLILSTAFGYWAHDVIDRKCEKKYEYINAHVVCHERSAIKKTGYAALQGKLESFIEEETNAGKISEVSIYFRDLADGPVFGINETADFAPASLLKVPLALVYLTQAERDPNILSKKLSVAEPQWSFSKHFQSSQEDVDPGKPHTVEELIMHMLVHSDNNAYGVLQTYMFESGQKDMIPQTFLELGFLDPADIHDETLSVRRYAGIFRALHNVSYVNAELSEKILNWLTRSEFEQGLRAGIPETINIAHKFGERFSDDGKKQLHDCGIVYYPDSPYLLCIMTKGTSFDDLSAVISHISAEVYKEVESRRL